MKANVIPEHWFNYVWIFIWGWLLGLPALIIAFVTGAYALALWLTLVTTVAVGLFALLSNVKNVDKIFVWKFCETWFGFVVAISPAMMVQLA